MSPPDPEQAVLDNGDEAVESPLEAVIDDGAAADPLQKGGQKQKKNKCQKRARGKTVIIIAGGWTYENKEAEIFAIEKDSWKPTTNDFEVVVKADNGNPLPASNPSEFFDHIANQPGTIGRVVFVGHGSAFGIVFSGDAGGYGGGKALNKDNLAEFRGDINKKIKPKLHPNAKIDLITCYAAADEEFIDALVNAFDRCVRGFDSAIEYRNPKVTDGKTITGRGLTRTSPKKKYRKGWKHLGLQVGVSP